ncbi:MAG TPA: SpoVG family protein [Symbiobacteriaceae bacterium]
MANQYSLADLITDVKVTPLQGGGNNKIVAFARVTLADCFVLNDIRVIEGQNGLFLGMPARKARGSDGEDKYFDIYYPITKEAREELTQAVVQAYEEAINNGGRRTASRSASSRPAANSHSRPAPARAVAARTAAYADLDDDDDVPF